MSAAVFGALILAAGWLTMPEARAQAFADPTRPPSASAEQEGEAPPAGKQLQSVLFSGGRKVAVIDGTMVPLGGTYGDAQLVKISETEVVLKQGEETETLKLYPGVEKRAVKRGASRARVGAAAQGPGPHGGAK
ncbi:MAG: MSHA biogenesis protein MshK [Burkholderiales bacterium]